MTTRPYIELLKRLCDAIPAAELNALLERTDIKPTRHGRFREPTDEELPGISLIFVNDSLGNVLTMGETERRLEVDMHGQMAIAAETSEQADSDDPTGMEEPAALLAAAEGLVRGSDLYDLIEDIIFADVHPDESSTADEVRMVRHLTLIYRVSTDDPDVILWQGMDA